MEHREKLAVYFKMDNKYHHLFNIIQMGKNGDVDLKITDFYNNGVIKTQVRYDGFLTDQEMEQSEIIRKTEFTYHKDGLVVNKTKDYSHPDYYNPYGNGVKWKPTNEISDFQPILNIEIRRMAIYNTYYTQLPTATNKKSNYVCECNELFEPKGTYFLVLLIVNKQFPFCKFGCYSNFTDSIIELNKDLDLCLFIQRHQFPQPTQYYSQRFQSMITPYPLNSINFCNKDTSKQELIEKLGDTMFDPIFFQFLKLFNDGHYYDFSNAQLEIIDEIDKFYIGHEGSRALPKPLFCKYILSSIKDYKEFNRKKTEQKQAILKQTNDYILNTETLQLYD